VVGHIGQQHANRVVAILLNQRAWNDFGGRCREQKHTLMSDCRTIRRLELPRIPFAHFGESKGRVSSIEPGQERLSRTPNS